MNAVSGKAFLTASVVAASVLVATSFLPHSAKAEEEKVLNIYNWSDYIAPDTLAKFTAETGIKVNYDVYDANEVLEVKLMAGRSGYDVVFPGAAPFLAQQIKAGVYQALDRSKLPNYKEIDPDTLKTLEKSDPGNQFAVPYMIAPTGIGYNVEKVRKIMGDDFVIDSWSALFDPEVLEKLKSCGVTWLDAPTETIPAALAFLGKNPDSQDKDDLTAAETLLLKARPFTKYLHSSKYISDLANGDICVAHGYGGDLQQARFRARDAGKGVDINVIIPKEGAQTVIDVMAVPKDAPHPENAHRFIDFIMRPDIIAPITNTVGYANAIPASKQFINPDIANDPAIYPSEEVRKKFFVVSPAQRDYERLRTRVWTRIKTNR